MPELPEVQTVVNSLLPWVSMSVIVSGELLRDDVLTPSGCGFIESVTGRRVQCLFRRAKRIVFTLDDGNSFYIHLGMTGRLRVESPDAPLLKHTHLVLNFRSDSGQESQVRFIDPRRFGGIWWLGDCCNDSDLGPEPLNISVRELSDRLAGTKRFIKCTLLDQAVIAGLGNIYVDEALHAAGIHPLTRTDRLRQDQIVRLTRAIKSVLKRAIHHGGSTLRDYVDAAGRAGNFQKVHRVYDREDKPCLRCGTAVKRIVVGGRSTHFCPDCQPRRNRKTSR